MIRTHKNVRSLYKMEYTYRGGNSWTAYADNETEMVDFFETMTPFLAEKSSVKVAGYQVIYPGGLKSEVYSDYVTANMNRPIHCDIMPVFP